MPFILLEIRAKFQRKELLTANSKFACHENIKICCVSKQKDKMSVRILTFHYLYINKNGKQMLRSWMQFKLLFKFLKLVTLTHCMPLNQWIWFVNIKK